MENEKKPNIEIFSSYLCGVCRKLVLFENITNHECLQGYYSWRLTDDGTFYPLNDDEYVAEPSTNAVASNKKKKTYDNPTLADKKKKSETLPSMDDEETEMYIEEVKKRKPLWDLTVSHKLRTLKQKEKLWMEAVDAAGLRDKLKDADMAYRKFKSLKDAYHRVCKKNKLLNGSGKKHEFHTKWKHYKLLEFLLPVLLREKTDSKIEFGEQIRESNLDEDFCEEITKETEEASDQITSRPEALNDINIDEFISPKSILSPKDSTLQQGGQPSGFQQTRSQSHFSSEHPVQISSRTPSQGRGRLMAGHTLRQRPGRLMAGPRQQAQPQSAPMQEIPTNENWDYDNRQDQDSQASLASVILGFAKATREQSTAPYPAPPVLTEVDLFSRQIALQLNRIPIHPRRHYMQELLKQATEKADIYDPPNDDQT